MLSHYMGVSSWTQFKKNKTKKNKSILCNKKTFLFTWSKINVGIKARANTEICFLFVYRVYSKYHGIVLLDY